MSLLVIADRCQYCSRFLPPRDINRYANGNVLMCEQCRQDRHYRELMRLATCEPPTECAECRVAFSDLAAIATRISDKQSVRMFAEWKDGTYQFLCEWCAGVYELKRKDLFGGTEHGERVLNLR